MTITFRSYEIGYEPDSSAPYETVIQNGWSSYLVFYATAPDSTYSAASAE